MKLFVNLTTEDGELWERVEVDVDQLLSHEKALLVADLVLEIEAAARIIRARARS